MNIEFYVFTLSYKFQISYQCQSLKYVQGCKRFLRGRLDECMQM